MVVRLMILLLLNNNVLKNNIMKYLKRFEIETQCTTYMDSEEYIEPFVGLVDENDNVHYNKK